MKKDKDLIIISIISFILFFSYPLLLMTGLISFKVIVYRILLYIIYPLCFLLSAIYCNLKNKNKLKLFIILVMIFGINLLLFYNYTSLVYLFVNICFYILGILISNLFITNHK